MNTIAQLHATDGTSVDYIDEIIGSNHLGDAYRTQDGSHSLLLFKEKPDQDTWKRLVTMVEERNPCRDPAHGAYWEKLFCWPEKLIDDGEMGVLFPTWPKAFFFTAGHLKGQVKEARWFTSAKLRKLLTPSEKGDWLSYFRICIKLSRALALLHDNSMVHGGVCLETLLVDPPNGNAMLINPVDGPSLYRRRANRDFLSPEGHGPIGETDAAQTLPTREADCHALATLIYMHLLYRHPLRGRKVHDLDPDKDEALLLGEKALFIENAQNPSNRPPSQIEPAYLPWADVSKRPYSITGQYLGQLFNAAFIRGLHEPAKRPSAKAWERALVRTVDLLQPCGNPDCRQKWFIPSPPESYACPFCGWKLKGTLPVLHFATKNDQNDFKPDHHKLMVYHNQYFYPWHINAGIFPDHRITDEQKRPVGYFAFHSGKWVMVNQNVPEMKDLSTQQDIPINDGVELKNGKLILFSEHPGGRKVYVELIKVPA